MNTQEIIDNNILLAEFMGFIDNGCSEEGFLIDPNTNYDISISSLNYNSDWNWLMQIVDRIESLKFAVYIKTRGCFIEGENEKLVAFEFTSDKPKLEATYTACVDFVKWYGQNKGEN